MIFIQYIVSLYHTILLYTLYYKYKYSYQYMNRVSYLHHARARRPRTPTTR